MPLLQDTGYYGPGNWSLGNIKLPELGITERFGGNQDSLERATARRVMGGPDYSIAPETKDFRVTEGMDDVLGTNISGSGSVGTGGGEPSQPTSSGGGGGGGSWDEGDSGGGGGGYDASEMLKSAGIPSSEKSNLFKQYGVDNTPDLLAAMQAEKEARMREIENVYNPVMNYLGEAEQRIEGQLGSAQDEIRSLIGESKRTLGQQREQGERQIEMQEQQGSQRRSDALTDATRLFNELRRGGRQRYGGASSAGEAYQAIAGQQLQRNRANIQQEFNRFMNQAAFAKQNLQQQYSTSLQNLESQKNRMMSQIRREFENKLLEISRMRSQAESDKANMRLQALQDLRNQAFQIQLATAQQQQQLQQQANAVSQALDQQVQQQAQTLTQGTQGIPNQVMGTQTQFAQPTGGLNQQNMVGSINPDEEQFVGSIANPVRREDELNQ